MTNNGKNFPLKQSFVCIAQIASTYTSYENELKHVSAALSIDLISLFIHTLHTLSVHYVALLSMAGVPGVIYSNRYR